MALMWAIAIICLVYVCDIWMQKELPYFVAIVHLHLKTNYNFKLFRNFH